MAWYLYTMMSLGRSSTCAYTACDTFDLTSLSLFFSLTSPSLPLSSRGQVVYPLFWACPLIAVHIIRFNYSTLPREFSTHRVAETCQKRYWCYIHSKKWWHNRHTNGLQWAPHLTLLLCTLCLQLAIGWNNINYQTLTCSYCGWLLEIILDSPTYSSYTYLKRHVK